MNKDQIKGRTEEVAGKTKKVVGKVVNDESLKDKGRMEEAAGKARATYGDIKNDTQKESGQVTGHLAPGTPGRSDRRPMSVAASGGVFEFRSCDGLGDELSNCASFHPAK